MRPGDFAKMGFRCSGVECQTNNRGVERALSGAAKRTHRPVTSLRWLPSPARVVPSARSTALGTQQALRPVVRDEHFDLLHLRPQLHIANQPRRGHTEYRCVDLSDRAGLRDPLGADVSRRAGPGPDGPRHSPRRAISHSTAVGYRLTRIQRPGEPSLDHDAGRARRCQNRMSPSSPRSVNPWWSSSRFTST